VCSPINIKYTIIKYTIIKYTIIKYNRICTFGGFADVRTVKTAILIFNTREIRRCMSTQAF